MKLCPLPHKHTTARATETGIPIERQVHVPADIEGGSQAPVLLTTFEKFFPDVFADNLSNWASGQFGPYDHAFRRFDATQQRSAECEQFAFG